MYEIPQKLDFSNIRNLTELTKLNIANVQMTQKEFDEIKMIKELESLKIEISDKLGKEIIIPEYEKLREFEFSGKLETLKFVEKLKGIEKLSICNNDESNEIQDIEILKDFNKLEELQLIRINGVNNNLPDSKDIKVLILRECGIKNIEKLKEFKDIKEIDLQRNSLDDVTETDIQEIIRGKKIKLNFRDTNLFNKLNLKYDTGLLPEDEKRFKKYIGISESDDITKYDLITLLPDMWKEIPGNDVLNLIIDLGISDRLSENISIELNGLQRLSEKTMDFLKSNKIKNIKLTSLRGITVENLQELNCAKYYVEGDLLSNGIFGKYYDVDSIKEIVKIMQKIKVVVPENASQYEKFMQIYKIVGLAVNYDKSGCKDSEEYIEGNEFLTRSLKGVLLDRRAVCSGYSLALKYLLDYIGIKSERVGGYAYGNPELGHSWNQVKIDNKWYNVDLTWDSKRIQRGEPLEYCLVGDDEFYKTHTTDCGDTKVHVCEYDYIHENIESDEKIKKGIKEENFEKGNSQLFNMNDFKLNAQNNVISLEIVKDIKSVISDEKSKIDKQEEFEKN